VKRTVAIRGVAPIAKMMTNGVSTPIVGLPAGHISSMNDVAELRHLSHSTVPAMANVDVRRKTKIPKRRQAIRSVRRTATTLLGERGTGSPTYCQRITTTSCRTPENVPLGTEGNPYEQATDEAGAPCPMEVPP